MKATKLHEVHEVKVLHEFFQAAIDGRKPYSIRLNDRNYQIGDTLFKREWSQETGYTGREASFTITHLTDWGQPDNQVVLGIKMYDSMDWNEEKSLLPNMDEVVAEREKALKALEEVTPGPWITHRLVNGRIAVITDNGDLKIVYRDANLSDAVFAANAPEWLRNALERERLLIEEREQGKAEIENARSLRDFAVKKSNELIEENRQLKIEKAALLDEADMISDFWQEAIAKVTEQDKEIQRGTIEKERLALIIDRMADFYGCDLNEWLKDQE
jgi:hypothetical protein